MSDGAYVLPPITCTDDDHHICRVRGDDLEWHILRRVLCRSDKVRVFHLIVVQIVCKAAHILWGMVVLYLCTVVESGEMSVEASSVRHKE